METSQDRRVVDLADELGINISEALSLCAQYEIEAPYGSSPISDDAAELLTGVSNGSIDPKGSDFASLLAKASGSDSTVGSASSGATAAGSELDDFNHQTSVDDQTSDASSDRREGERRESDDRRGSADSEATAGAYDSFGVSGLGDLHGAKHRAEANKNRANKDRANKDRANNDTGRKLATPVPASSTAPAAPLLPLLASARIDQERDERKAAEVAKYHRRNGGRRSKKSDPVVTVEKPEYDPTKLIERYDDPERFVPSWLKALALLAALGLGVFAYQLVFSTSSPELASDETPTPVLLDGTCFNADPGLWLDTIVETPCVGLHDGEIFSSYVFPDAVDAVYPNVATLESQGRQACGTRFTAYTGDSLVASDYRIGVSFPSKAEWSNGDRVAYCSVLPAAGGKSRGSARR